MGKRKSLMRVTTPRFQLDCLFSLAVVAAWSADWRRVQLTIYASVPQASFSISMNPSDILRPDATGRTANRKYTNGGARS